MNGTGTRVLLVEDDARIRRVLQIALRDEGYQVLEAPDGGTALRTLQEQRVDVVVLDLMLPDMDGFEVCRRVRRTSDVPVIMASAKGDSHDIVAGLEAGADDYVVKPVVAKEISARIRALLRRTGGQRMHANSITSGSLEIRPHEAVVLQGGVPVQLTVTEFRLLDTLGERIGEVVSRQQLLQHVWGYDYLGDTRLVDVHVSRLRAKIEEDPSSPRHVATVRGLGYKLAP